MTLGVWILDAEGLQVSMFIEGYGMDAEITLVKMSCQLGLYGLDQA